ncbi:MAG: DNA repair protein RadA [Spirochaetes bacterium]|nr:DNA repair protein RadA [Spirochaetota bacterium]
MAGPKTTFTCSNCGHEEPRWLGRCPQCGEWNTFLEGLSSQRIQKGSVKQFRRGSSKEEAAILLSSVDSSQADAIDSSVRELNRVLGGGVFRGSTILLGGEPGIGKSTLLLQVAGGIGETCKSLYVSGEESPAQIRQRAERVGVQPGKIHIYAETELERILQCLNTLKPEFIVVDSIQTLYAPEMGSMPGTLNQMKYCCHEMSEWAKDLGAGLVFVAHITKEGLIAGPKVIEHMVDTVLYFEQGGGDLRFLRAVKNRFGSIDEIGLFSMGERGLREVSDPSSVFLVRRNGALPPGVVVAPVYEGSRVLMVELQALVVPAKGGISRVFSDRLDVGRVSRIAAVLEKQTNLRFSDQDIYVNVAGGIRISEVGIELPLALALYSARTGIPFPADTVVAGEVSLAGEVRPVSHIRRRFRSAQELGFSVCIGPEAWDEEQEHTSWIEVATVGEAVRTVFTSGLAPLDKAKQ